MSGELNRVQALVFGEVADEYDRIRPSYPEALVDDVLAFAGESGPALDVGAGTGRATVLFAARGVEVTAVEPDPAMAEVLRRNVSGASVTVEVATFEAHEPAAPYGLLYSAQAWHWTDAATRWSRAARMLRPGGTIALFWNDDVLADPLSRQRFQEVHERHVPDMYTEEYVPLTDEWVRGWEGYRELAGAPGFDPPEWRIHRATRELSTVDYVALLDTISRYRMLAEPVRAALYAELRSVLGERVALTTDAVLLLARRS